MHSQRALVPLGVRYALSLGIAADCPPSSSLTSPGTTRLDALFENFPDKLKLREVSTDLGLSSAPANADPCFRSHVIAQAVCDCLCYSTHVRDARRCL